MEATYVLFCPRSKRGGLRRALSDAAAGRVAWRERKGLFGSEFYIEGPAAAARRTHAAVALWLHEAGALG